jgi:hypothetical protein
MNEMKKTNEKGQVALILVLVASVAGTLVISLADRSTRDLRTQSLDTEKTRALKGAESGVEQALLSGGSVENFSLDDDVSFTTSYLNKGGDGMLSDLVEPGDVIDILVDGADSGVESARIYFSSESSMAAIKVSKYDVDGGVYSVEQYAYDGDSDRALENSFSDSDSGGSFEDVDFSDSAVVSIDPAATKLLRITVLYFASKIGVEPTGGDLPSQQVVISSVGSYSVSDDVSVKKRLELTKEMEKIPVIFDKVLYTNSRLAQ